MHITKIIKHGFDIDDPISFCSDIDVNLLSLIKNTFEHKCFRSCYIESINKIIQYSELEVDQEQNHTFCKVHVKFEVSATVYHPGEIINGCKVTKKLNEVIICETDKATIWLNTHKYLSSVTEGQLISIRVGKVKYEIGYNKISINGLRRIRTKRVEESPHFR